MQKELLFAKVLCFPLAAKEKKEKTIRARKPTREVGFEAQLGHICSLVLTLRSETWGQVGQGWAKPQVRSCSAERGWEQGRVVCR